MRTQIGIEAAAPPQRIFDLASDISRWPELLPHYRKVTIHSRNDGRVVATMSASRPLGPLDIPVSWRTEQWSDESERQELRVRFRHVAGPTRGMDVTWRISPSATGSRVTIDHEFSRPLPFMGANLLPRLIDRLFVRPIASRTLARFKSLAEAGDGAEAGAEAGAG